MSSFDVDQKVIELLRHRVYEYARAHSTEIDITDVQNRIPETLAQSQLRRNAIPDLMLRRFLVFCKPKYDVEAALQKFISCFTFRCKHGMTRLTVENTIPAEFFAMMPIIDCGTDRVGNKLVVARAKFYRKLPQIEFLFKRKMLFLSEQYDLQLERGHFTGLTVLGDLRGFNYWRDLHLEMVPFGMQMVSHYQGLVTKVLGYDLHWAFTFCYNMIHSMMSRVLGRDEVPFLLVNEKNIDEHVEPDQRPDFLGGTFRLAPQIPATVQPFLEMMQTILEEEKVDIEQKNLMKIAQYLQQFTGAFNGDSS